MSKRSASQLVESRIAVMTFQEIGNKLGLTEAGVANIYYRAMNKLRHPAYARRVSQLRELCTAAHAQTTHAHTISTAGER